MSVNAVEPMMVEDTPSTTAMNVTETDPTSSTDPSQRWQALEKLVSRPSPFGAETGQLAVGEFEPFENVSIIGAPPRCSEGGISASHVFNVRAVATKKRGGCCTRRVRLERFSMVDRAVYSKRGAVHPLAFLHQYKSFDGFVQLTCLQPPSSRERGGLTRRSGEYFSTVSLATRDVLHCTSVVSSIMLTGM